MTKSKVRNKVKDGIAFTGKSWSYVLRIPDPNTGRTKPKWVGGFDNEESALLARDEARVSLRKRTYVPPSERTLTEFIQTWLFNIHKQQLRPTSFHSYEKIVRNHIIPGLGAIKLSDLKPTDIQRFYGEVLAKTGVNGKPLSPRTAQYAGAILKKALKYAVEVEGVLSFNPASRVPLPKSNSSSVPTPWSFGELRQFLHIVKSHRLSFFFRLSAFTGARRGELLALRWSDFDGKGITISKSRVLAGKKVVEQNTTKGGKGGQRRVALDPETIQLFTEHRKRQIEERLLMGSSWVETGYVFVQENGEPLDTGTPTHLFKKFANRAGLRSTRLHDLRHLHATELLRLGEPLHVVSDRLGHKDPMVTATIYAHVSNEQGESASNTFANGSRNSAYS
jgi:integrase